MTQPVPACTEALGDNAPAERSSPHNHLVTIADGKWALWKWMALRGAGFSTAATGRLAAPTAAQHCDTLLRARRSGATPARSAVLEEQFRSVFVRETVDAASALAEFATTPLFREAVLWQNRQALRGSIDSFLRGQRAGKSRSSAHRHNEELVAKYVQRYCTKNETIGFFGPVGWATIDPTSNGVDVRPGTTLLAERHVYFEAWCIDAVAQALNRDVRMRPWLTPHRTHVMHVDGYRLFLPGRAAERLSEQDAAILNACDGSHTVRQIAADLSTHLLEPAHIVERIDAFCDRGLITLELSLPLDPHPDRLLERAIQRIGDDSLRREAMEALKALRVARDAVANNAGNPVGLDAALEDLETCFGRITGRSATRSAGKMYAARTLVYEDSRRDVDVRLGQNIVDAMSQPLQLLLTAARWLTFDLARRYAAAFDALYDDLVARGGSPDVSFLTFWYKAQPLLFGPRATLAADTWATFHKRWETILRFEPDDRHVQFRSDALSEIVGRTFDAPRPGWSHARWHSPDLMIAARSAAAITRGEYLIVLGEMHVAANTLSLPLYILQHPKPDTLRHAAFLDSTHPQLEPLVPKNSLPGQSARFMSSHLSPDDSWLALSSDRPPLDGTGSVAAGSLVVKRREGVLTVCDRPGTDSTAFRLVDVLGPILGQHVSNRFQLLAPKRHVPRVTFDNFVVIRETWRVSPEELSFAWCQSECDRYAGAREFMHARGLPRQVFVKLPTERKPLYLDFSSPVYVNILAKQVRLIANDRAQDAQIVMTEMLPTPDEAWLTDADGNSYTSEFRVVTVDLAATSPRSDTNGVAAERRAGTGQR